MKCPECRTACPDGSTYCFSCGAKIPIQDYAAPPEEDRNAARRSPIIPPEEGTRTLDEDSPAITLAPGAVFAGRYQVVEELGRGGMGCVFRVFDKTLQEDVALKFINPEIAAHKKTLERFSHELKTARRIVHKNVGRVFELEEREGVHFISMEYVQGENLKSLLRRAGPLSLGKTLRVAAQVCAGLSEAHGLGIVHRDLKSQNIMIDEKGNARIMDFGIALTPEMPRDSLASGLIGSPETMSPEQASGGPVDARTDIYALGIVLYQMATGELPFKAASTPMLLRKHKTEPPRDPRALNRQIPESLSRLILKCLEKDPALRFQSVGEIIPELERIGEDNDITVGIEGDTAAGHRTDIGILPSRLLRKKITVPAFALPAAVFIAAAAITWLLLRPSRPAAGDSGKTAIAVLPVIMPSDLEVVRQSLSGDVISELSRTLIDVRITPSHSMWLYRDTTKPLKQIGSELNVEYVLKLLLRHAGPGYMASAELSMVSSDAVYISWKEAYDAISQIQERLPQSLAQRLKLTLPAGGAKKIVGPAYMAYLKGWEAERKYRDFDQPEDFETARAQYQEAIASAGPSGLAKAYVGLGDIYQGRFFSPAGDRDPNDFYQMRLAYEKAYDLDPKLAEANVGLAWTYFFKKDHENAVKYYREALRLEPNNAEALFNFASFLRDIGLFDQALPLFKKACEIDPFWMEYVNQMARCRMMRGDIEGAVHDVQSGLTKDPENTSLRLLQARLQLMTGKIDDASTLIEAVRKARPEHEGIPRLMALVAAIQGKKNEALDLLKSYDRIRYSTSLSVVYSMLGMKDEAVANIQEAIDHGFEKAGTYQYPYIYLKNCPFFRNLQNDPRFQTILADAEREYQVNLRLYGASKETT